MLTGAPGSQGSRLAHALGYLRTLLEYQLVGKLAEAAMVGDIAALRATLFAPPILLPIPESVQETVETVETVAEGFARVTEPEGFNRRGLLAKTLAAIEKSGQALIVETSNLIPSQVRKADAHDVNAANRAERLTDLERVLAQADSGNGPVTFSGKGPDLYSAPLPGSPSAPVGVSHARAQVGSKVRRGRGVTGGNAWINSPRKSFPSFPTESGLPSIQGRRL